MGNLGFDSLIFNNTILEYLQAFFFTAAVYIFVKIFDRFFLNRITGLIKKYSQSLAEFLEDIILKRLYMLLYFLTFYLIFTQFETIALLDKIIQIILIIFTVIYSVLIIQDLLSYLIKKYWDKKESSDEQQKLMSISLIGLRIIIWSIALLFVLDNLNIEITGLITGLGIGGIAVAFAAQNILNDLFNYFTIFFDKPFDIGDFVIVGDYKGNIEHIGVKTTRIRSLSGEQLIISNTDLVNSRVNNYKRMEKRRINFNFGLTYDTPLEKLKKVPEIIEEIITSQQGAEFDRAHFSNYADYSLLFEVVYYVTDSDYKVYMDIQQKINFILHEKLDQLGVEFAYPTQTIYLNEKEKNSSI